MIEEGQLILEVTKEQMEGSINRLDDVLSKIRAGKANPQMISNVTLDYYGSTTPLPQMSNINTPDSQTISIQPFDKSTLEDIEKAISESELGLNPATSGETIRVILPDLTEETRRDFIKKAKAEAENAKISVRNVRRDGNSQLKDFLKEKRSLKMKKDKEKKKYKN